MVCAKASSLGLLWALLALSGAIPAAINEAHGCKIAQQEGATSASQCLNCDADGRCRKCSGVIIYGSRECADSCPRGYQEEWSTLVDYMGRLCKESGPWWLEDGVGLTGRRLAVVVGTCSGLLISLLLICGAFVYIKCWRSQQPNTDSCKNSSTPVDSAGYGFSHRYPQLAWDEIERQEFLQQLRALQPDAHIFLAMLNDTRRKFRKIHMKNGKADSRCKAYRAVLRDLCRILALLNQKDFQNMTLPTDWKKLLSWGERVLKRYKKQHCLVATALVKEPSKILQMQIQVHCEPPKDSCERKCSELVSFQPNGKIQHDGLPKTPGSEGSTKITNGDSPFIGSPHFLTAMRQELLPGRPAIVVDMVDEEGMTHGDQEEHCSHGYGITSSFHTPVPSDWTRNNHWGYDDDEFVPLGHRPQDEITTEL
ncbi:uncharacterized protein LOC124155976 isoform X2 [Ischnura elegans]|uniref:uncharacterized protein LOC124155976 isoform X2 n=1 Tax=Ischnura elegans TaxID=197161 RepID=UPI001ED87CCE|nr:uncharacterized protein LOC124155976 isoform X2 [Ischnura elegans]